MSIATTGRVILMAKPEKIGIEEKTSKTVQANIQFKAHAVKVGMVWEPLEAGDQAVWTGYFNLIKKDGNANEINFNSLREALGWDGTSFSSLQDGDFADVECQIVIDDETDPSGKAHRRVQFINPRDYVGGSSVDKAEPQTISALDKKFGPLMRALAGKKPVAGPAPAAGKPLGLDVAWAAFLTRVNDYARENPEQAYDTAKQKSVFLKVVGELFPGQDMKKLTPAQWVEAQTEITRNFSPAIESIVPF